MSLLKSVYRRRLKTNTLKDSDEDKNDEPDGGRNYGDESRTKKMKSESKRRVAKPARIAIIRPPERVRTRGYNLILASKLALKRAKRDTLSSKRDTLSSKRAKLKEDCSSVESISSATQVAKTLLPSGESTSKGRRLSTRHAEVDEDSNSASESTKKSHQSSGSSSKDEGAAATRAVKEVKQKAVVSPKKTPPKKVTANTSTSHQCGEIPTFQPTEAEFEDPITYINKIRPIAEPHGLCKIIPPNSWKLDSTKLSEDIRFTSQVQHVHRLCQRWGPNVQHSAAISQHLLSETTDVVNAPQIGGVEIDLPQLYKLVEEAGGLPKMADKKHWARIADVMNVPKQAMDRTMRLYDIYCRHVLPYATLSESEKSQLEEEVQAIHELQTVEDDAITRGKSMSASWFHRIARNIHAMWFKEDPSPQQVETEFWHIVEKRDKHVAVQCGHINTRAQASGFPTRKDSSYYRHPWNLNKLPGNSQSVLKYLGPVAGITIPTLHMGMLFSTSCWSSDPHGLPYVQYLHTGSDIIWYCIPKSQRSKFKMAMTEVVPNLITNKPRWLKEDCVMVNPTLLRQKGVKVARCIHSPRQFVVVFPGTYTATITCGYSVSESVHFATSKWLSSSMDTATALTRSGEKELFSLCALLFGLAQDKDVEPETLSEALPLLSTLVYRELDLRTQIQALGLRGEKRAVFSESSSSSLGALKKRGERGGAVVEEDTQCEMCEKMCYLSMVLNEQDEQVLCLDHGLRHVQRKKNLRSTRLYLRYSQSELEAILKEAKERHAALSLSGNGNCSKTRATSKQMV